MATRTSEKRALDAAYYQANKERIKARVSAYQQANRAINNAAVRRWEARNPVAKKAFGAARNAFVHFGEPVDWQLFYLLFQLPCYICGVSPSVGVDHEVARINGGRNEPDNLQPCCLSCNARKGPSDRDHARAVRQDAALSLPQ